MNSIAWIKGHFHIPDELWQNYNFFELFPLDGGGSFIFDDFAGTRDDEEMTTKLLSGELLQKWGKPGKMNWLDYGTAANTELYCWLHRWYYLACLAKTYYNSKTEGNANELLAEKFFEILLDWEEKIGYPTDKEDFLTMEHNSLEYDKRWQQSKVAPDEKCPWEWYDFNPAQRLLIMIYAVKLLEGSKALKKYNSKLYEWIVVHANTIYWSTQKYGYQSHNHHTLRMMTLFVTGMLIKNDNSNSWIEIALEMQVKHLKKDFFKDGLYKESLPGYMPFVMTHFREILLCAKSNNYKIPDIFEERIINFLTLLKQFEMPNGYLPVINDGPHAKINATKDLIEYYFPAEKNENKTFFPNVANGFPIFRDSSTYLIFDANYAHSCHVQAGKLGFVLWKNNEPFIIEGGCCNYDNPDFQKYFRRGYAHSTLLINGQEDAVWESFWSWEQRANPKIIFCDEGDVPHIEANSDGFKRMGIEFKRKIERSKDNLFIINDSIVNSKKNINKYAFRFICGQKNVEIENNQVVIKGEKTECILSSENNFKIEQQQLQTNFLGKMEMMPAVDFLIETNKDFNTTFKLEFKNI